MNEWWHSVDMSDMDDVEVSFFEDSMTPEEYQRYSSE